MFISPGCLPGGTPADHPSKGVVDIFPWRSVRKQAVDLNGASFALACLSGVSGASKNEPSALVP